MTGMVVNAGQAFDHQRDARQRPQVGGEAVAPRPLPQGLLHPAELPSLELGFAANQTGGVEGAHASAAPLRVPAADALAAHLELTGDGGQDHPARGKQAARLFAPEFKLVEIAAGANRRRHASSINDPDGIVTIFCDIVTVLCDIQ